MKTLKEFFTGKSNKVTNELTFQKNENKVIGNQTLYQCPMKCEGDKTYNTPGNCPDCNMKLVPATEKGSKVHTHVHNGNGNSHHGCC